MNYSAKIKQVYITISDALKEVKVWIWHLTVDMKVRQHSESSKEI